MDNMDDNSLHSAGGATRKGWFYWFVIAPLGWLDRNIEKIFILIAYSGMAGILFVEVVRRFAFGQQAAWSTTIPVYLFLWLAWFGASYNVRKRTHLSLSELRARFPYPVQYACMILDGLLWIVFGIIVMYWSTRQVQLSYMNFAIVSGTDEIMQWWFYMALPLAWGLIMIRAVQNMVLDTLTFRRGKPFPLNQSMLD
ncbi:TRAP-type C4-dicarboxylate transport system permease small subunit [Natronocella acetinitrilica]|uniref:TRAP transporter small permease protein n=1 Tax=Natronocella acetinitrilica TaxID=414046 RepID=A0AAE3G6Y4_9GAMM|nr:TRAP transporter small permease [Natronocella acetinitrilica]MCP1676966.1 TRAP-type C4-dicarboxylate transport system permease small subunit [Natronocella acetinitrilica]